MSSNIHKIKVKEIFNRVAFVIGVKDHHCNGEIAKALNVKPNRASGWKNRNKIPWDELYIFAVKNSLPLEYFLTGKEAPQVSKNIEDSGQSAFIKVIGQLTKKYEELLAGAREYIKGHHPPGGEQERRKGLTTLKKLVNN